MSRFEEWCKKGRDIFLRNTKVAENYFFMTLLQVLSLFIGLLLYPYLIRVLGAEKYGLYVLSISIASYFLIMVSFGFSWLGLKDISKNKDDREIKSRVLSTVFSAKLLLAVFVFALFFLLVQTIPFFSRNTVILFLSFVQVIIPDLLFPTWYFQGIQKMKIVTYIQLIFRAVTIPFIFIFIKQPVDVEIYAVIVASSLVLAGVVSIIYLVKKEKLRLRLVPFVGIKEYLKKALPFFWTEAFGVAKQESITLIIGAFMGLRDVAVYDLANKIVSIPRIMTSKINGAIFPQLIQNPQISTIKKIIRAESLIGTGIIALIASFGYWIVLLLGGEPLIDAYPIAVILSVTITTSLIVGGFINFVFIPSGNYYAVTQSQLVGFTSFLGIGLSVLVFWNSIFAVVIAMALSGIMETAYSVHCIKKYNLL
jgi:PST family polysaccharide transporter